MVNRQKVGQMMMLDRAKRSMLASSIFLGQSSHIIVSLWVDSNTAAVTITQTIIIWPIQTEHFTPVKRVPLTIHITKHSAKGTLPTEHTQ